MCECKRLGAGLIFQYSFYFSVEICSVELSCKWDFDKGTTHILWNMNTLMCLSIGTPKNNKFSICSKWKIHYF